MKKGIALLLSGLLLLALAGCGGAKERYTPVSGLDPEEKATLTIAIPYETNKALNTVANAFTNKYPNISVHLQYIEDYDTNAVQLFKEDRLDMILQKDVFNEEYYSTDEATKEKTLTGTRPEDYFYNFAADPEIDFSGTSPDISGNYLHTDTDEAGAENKYIFSYPLGGETRGVFVNKTLLDSYGLSVPGNFTQLLACCETLKANGLVPVQGGVATAAYSLGLAQAANPVVHDGEALAKMEAADEGVSLLFADILSKFYTLATNRYFDYKSVEETGNFTITSELGQAQSFLGLTSDEDTFEISKPKNNFGYVAFMPYISSMETVISSLIDEYILDTEFVFICSPMNDEGSNSPAYITPYYGICGNKNSPNLIWIREFVNFIFQPEVNKTFALESGIIPNTADAMQLAAERYGLDAGTDITLCGQIRFRDDYNGYTPIASSLLAALKCNAQKYMVALDPVPGGEPQWMISSSGEEFLYMGNGETEVYRKYVGEEDPTRPGYAFCTLEYYLDNTENEFARYRVN